MDEQIEQMMRTLKLGGLAKEWRSVEHKSNEQYVSDLLRVENRLTPPACQARRGSGSSSDRRGRRHCSRCRRHRCRRP